MIRKIIRIDEEKCNGCGACAQACHEGAIEMIDGKAKLTRENYCDGLGDCLPACPTNAISFEEREAPAYDEAAVKRAQAQRTVSASTSERANTASVFGARSKQFSGCPGSRPVAASASEQVGTETPLGARGKPLSGCTGSAARAIDRQQAAAPIKACTSQLRQWPVQIKLAPVSAPYFDGAHLLIAADCTAYAYGSFHEEFMKNRITLIGCPKLDEGDYAEKLTAIIAGNDIRSLTIVRMEVPCCGGIENAAKRALQASGKFIPWRVVTVTTDGRLKE